MNFIEKNTKKVALFLCIATAASALTTVYAASNSTGWNDGVYMQDGKVASGWVITEDGTYYCNAEGKALKGFQEINGETYYFDENGVKLSGEQTIAGNTYIFNEKGILVTGWNDDKTSYNNAFGTKVTGVQKIDEKTYLFDEEGKIMTGWQKVDNKKVYFNADGSMAVTKTKIGDKTYHFQKDGSLKTGWSKKDGETFYYDSYGKMTTGWLTYKGDKYYFDKYGQMVEDCEFAGYKFDKDGVSSKIEEKEEATDKQSLESTDSSSSTSASTEAKVTSNDGIANAALAQLGVVQDCTALVTNALAANGIYFHGWPAEYMSLGTITSNPQPGDLIYYADGGLGAAHIAVYIGNGQAVHGGWLGNQTVIDSANVGSGPVYIHIN